VCESEPLRPPAPGEKSCAHSDPTAAALAAAGGCATTIRTDQVAPAATWPWTSGCRRRRRQAAAARIASAHAAAATAFLCAVYDFLFTISSLATMRPPPPRVPSRAGVGVRWDGGGRYTSSARSVNYVTELPRQQSGVAPSPLPLPAAGRKAGGCRCWRCCHARYTGRELPQPPCQYVAQNGLKYSSLSRTELALTRTLDQGLPEPRRVTQP
jgi:hypothetical protein